ncbi:hypothetical protein Tco_0839955 [Tanacetum coccineum]|uniref:Uncharacterized protein n=1 Tax=Tanacetum coccineum TaxID=301880 RepID=A0ABQ5AW67_9ASTR
MKNQSVHGNLGRFTSREENPWSPTTHGIYKLMMVDKETTLQVTTKQVNDQFLQTTPTRLVKIFDDIRSERLARSTNPLALVAAAQPYSDNYYQAPKPQRSNAPSNKQSSSTRPSASTRHKGKEIAKPVTPQSESVFEKPKRVKDYAYHKEKMMMCKQAEQDFKEVSPEESSSTGQPLEQVQNHDENDVFANVRRHSEQPESINDTYVLEKDDSNVIPDSSNICTNDNQVDQNATECVDERVALANLIANLTLDTEENKTILKQLKKSKSIIDSRN